MHVCLHANISISMEHICMQKYIYMYKLLDGVHALINTSMHTYLYTDTYTCLSILHTYIFTW